ncbi:MAG: hypothetical protein WCF03_14020 [Nitrososphaeraceae archaeon]
MCFLVLPRSSGGGNLHQSNGDPISTPQSHKPCPNGSAPDVDGNCTRTPSTPRPPSSSLENNSSKILSQPSQLLPSSPTTTCPDGSSPDTNGNCTPYPLPPDP